MHAWVLESVGEDFGVFVQVIVLLLAPAVLGFQCQVLAVGVRYVGGQVLLPEGRVEKLPVLFAVSLAVEWLGGRGGSMGAGLCGCAGAFRDCGRGLAAARWVASCVVCSVLLG